ncbi:TlpA family protein disulfide reductase [Flavobacterium rhizosphaerae]|uniref:TlpA disulfide reductase family protein n=1 Tax=Flavobacterium rhizosphaerae TaxID=3163298 RepID=A0ABW8YV52_9FLAO
MVDIILNVWATWCGPCKEEFKQKEELYSLLAKQGVTPIYISIDKNMRDESWKKMINYYGLKSYHARTNEISENDLRKLFNNNGNILIPWHILVNENGTIVNKYALSIDKPNDLKQKLEKL